MKRTMRCLVVAGCALLVWGCATTLRATTDYDQSVDFSSYQSFGWIDPNPLIRSVTQRPVSPLIVDRLKAETKDILTSKGLRFEEDPAAADLAVAFTIGSRDGIRITSHPTRSFRNSPRGRRGYTWGGYWGGSTVTTRTYTEGQLAVDLFSVGEARPVWHGTTSTRVLRSDREDPSELIRSALEAILAEFPPG